MNAPEPAPPPAPAPAPAPRPLPARKKSGRGCVIALAVVGGLGVLGVLGVALAIWRFASTKEGKAVFGMIGDMAELAQEAQSAPGAKEVRAIGCDTAMAMDMDRMQRILNERLDAGSHGTMPFSKMVVCQVGVFGKTPPTCADVARAYLSGAPQPERGFVAQVQRQGSGNRPVCSELYDPDGTKVKDLAPGSTPTLPGTK